MAPPTITLNMIVKNESHVITKTLENLCSKINFDYWVISDTGSTDTTKELIKDFFKNKNIEGELHEDEWKDFGHNRTKALEYAYNKTDLLLVFDADDELNGDFSLPKTIEHDSYHLKFGNGYGLNYWRVLLINNRRKWKYVGVLHEFIALADDKPGKNAFIDGNYHVRHGTDGGRSKDENKFKSDASILEKAFSELDENDSLRNRYAFYCANSYNDGGMNDKAIEWYKKTIDLKGGWNQEKYRCCIKLFNIYNNKNELENAVFYALKSYKFDKTRVEGIAKLVQYYCYIEMNDVAYMYYSLIKDYYENEYIKGDAFIDKLFVDILDYDFFLPYYMIIVSERVKKYEVGVKMYDMIFTKKKQGGQWFIDNLLYNFKFFVKYVNKKLIDKLKEYLIFLEINGLKIKKEFYESVSDILYEN